MKKRYILMLALAVALFSLFGLSASASNSALATISVSDENVAVGSEFTVFVVLSECNDAKSMMIEPIYDASALELKSGVWLLQDAVLSDNWNAEYGDAAIAFDKETNINGKVFKMVFTVLPEAGLGSTKIGCNAIVKSGTENIDVTVQECNINISCTHDFTDNEPFENCLKSPATCSSKAIYYTRCSLCGEKGTSVFEYGEKDTSNHVGGTVIKNAVSPTEDNEGYTGDLYCLSCNTVLQYGEAIGRLDHVHISVSIEGIAPTCTDKGLTNGEKCSICNAIIREQKIIEPLGHTEIIINGKEETCISKGISNGKKCSVCDEILEAQFEIAPKGHSEITIPGREATCISTGRTEGKRCSECDEITLAQTIIGTTAHNEVIIPGRDATCTRSGRTEGRECSICGEITVEQKVIPAFGHNEQQAENKDATCVESGYEGEIKCITCGEIMAERYIIHALGHQYDDEKDSQCNRCGEIREIPTEPVTGSNTEKPTEEPTRSEENPTEKPTESINEPTEEHPTELPTIESTENPTDSDSKEKSGCNSSIYSGMAIIFAVATALGFVFKKKKK